MSGGERSKSANAGKAKSYKYQITRKRKRDSRRKFMSQTEKRIMRFLLALAQAQL